MENKKIIILTQYFYPEMGAPQSRLFEMAKGLIKFGWQVNVITSMPNYPTGKIFEKYKGKLIRKEKVDGIDVIRYWIYASNSRNSLPRIFSMISFSMMSFFSVFKLTRMRPAFIITESPPLTLGFTGLMLSRFCKAKHLLNVSDIWPLSAYELGALSKGRLYRKLESLENYLYKKSFGCIGQSQQIVEHIKQKGVLKVCLFRNGVDIGRFNILHEQKNNADKTLKIVYAGLLGVAQGILDLCKNIDFKMVGVEFHIYGDGNEKKQLDAYIMQNPNRNIFIHEKIEREEIPTTLRKYDLTIIPLQKEIFGAVPSKIYEAMAAGLPVLFSGGGEGAKIIQDYKVGWTCNPSDFNNMILILKQIVNTPRQQIMELGKHCKDVALAVFDRAIQIKNLNGFLLQSGHA